MLVAALMSAQLAMPSVALAGQATARLAVEHEFGFEYHAFVFRYEASASELNDVRVRVVGSVVRVRDIARVVAGRGCHRVGRHEARCRIRRRALPRRYGFEIAVNVIAKDEHDGVRVAFRRLTFVRVNGGAGNDGIVAQGGGRVHEGGVLVGGSGNDTLIGAGGDEELDGGRGEDVVRGRAGHDLLVAAGPHSLEDGDVLDGGRDQDVVSYSGSAEVAVDLSDPAGDGRPGENDQLRRIEDVSGGAGPNRLTGDDGPNVLTGSTNPDVHDRLDGRGGNDWLEGYDGLNELIGGTGDDELDDPSSHASCGSGNDVLTSTELMPRIDADCERANITLGPQVSPQPLHASNGTVRIPFFPREAGRIRVVIKGRDAPEAVLARGLVRVPSRRRSGDGVQMRTISLTAEGHARLLAADSVPVLITLWRRGLRDSATRFHTSVLG